MKSRIENELDDIFTRFSEEEGFENTLLRYKIREVLPHVVGPRVLDIGCGVGLLCRVLAERFERVVGLDGSPVKIARAQQLGGSSNISYFCELFEKWSPPHLFETIITTNVLEHVADALAFLKRNRELVVPAGRLIVTVPNALGLHKRIGFQMGLIKDFYELTEADHAKGHRRVYDRRQLEADIVAAGFKLLHSGGILLKPLSHSQMNTWDEAVVDALYEVGKELPDYCSSLMVVAVKGD